MIEQSQNESSSNFLKTDGGKTKSNAIEVPSISLPKGGGAIKGIDEKFSVNAVNGTASFSIPLPFSPARGASPSLSLSYNSGSGNGIFGLGWNLSLASIKRKTDKGLPQYIDATDSDTFLFSEAEDLVPEFKKENDGSFSIDTNGDYIIKEKDSPDGIFQIKYYKPRIEGSFARIEQWTEKTTEIIKWRIITKDNVTTLFGWSSNSIIADPKDNKKIFEWLPEFVFDDKGNCAHYIYKPEDDKGFDPSLLHNRNRFAGGGITYTNIYLEKVLYGNKTPYKMFGNDFPDAADYLFETIFDYGEYDLNSPFSRIKDWDYRTDSFSDYKAGFEIRSTRLCKRILLYHHFKGANEYDGLVRSVNFEYDVTSQLDFTFLKSITAFGYIKKADGTYSSKNLPATEFIYQKHEWNKDVKTISTENLVHAPSAFDEQQYQFTDLFNEGLSGILTEQANGWYYKHNLGDGKFEQAQLVTPKPSFMGLGRQLQLTDLDADGGKQLVSYGPEPKGFFELNDDNEWQPFKNFQALPNVDFGDANTRMLDLNGDGKPEVVISEDNIFTWYESDGRSGFLQAQKATKPFDEEAGPHIVFADQKQTIFLADMSGDGMTDIVRIRNGEICYWPNLGYGKFGAKVGMDNAPLFDHPDSFNPSFLRLADIDGSGTTDIIYLGKNKFTCWMNLSGNTFSTSSFEIDAFPHIDNHAKITVTDLLGNGVACIVWSSSLAKDAEAPLRYIDLMNSKKPHLMVFYKNNLGKEVTMEYTASTKFYIDDKLAGKPWITKLHFPVHCISKTITEDKITGWKFSSSYKYHHGYYDHPEREFRGFGMVEQTDAEDFEHWEKSDATNITNAELHQEPVVSKTWFHTGAFIRKEKILTQFAHEYWYEEMANQGYVVANNEVALPDAIITGSPDIQQTIIDNLSAEEWQQALSSCKRMTLRSEVFALDAIKYGNTPAAKQKELIPYSVATHNCIIELLQPKGKNKHAIFIVKESEVITYSYEREIDDEDNDNIYSTDPRIAHTLNIKLDEFANVLEAVSIVYPRINPDTVLPAETQADQNKTTIIYTKNKFTNDDLTDDILYPDIYRLPLPSEVKTFELRGVTKSGGIYSLTDFENILDDGISQTALYHEIDKALTPGTPQKRLIEHIRSIYYNNNLIDALPLHQLHSLAIPFESYQLAYTPELLNDIYGGKVNSALMTEGKFTNSEGDANWWVRSGIAQYISGTETAADSQNRFYTPISYTDPFQSKTKVKYYGDYFLFIKEIEDAIGNITKVENLDSTKPGFNFRTLSPIWMKDFNGNYSVAISDELGLVKAMAIMGKGTDADDLTGFNEFTDASEAALINSFLNVPKTPEGVTDSVALANIGKQLLKHATARFVYDFDVYKTKSKPTVAASIAREEHFQKNNNSLVQLSFEYSNGFGKVAMKKVQAEPGQAKKAVVAGDVVTVIDVDTSALNPKQLRWIGNGKTILNNKGNTVKQYEPYFSVNNDYEDFKELVETGVTSIMYYDAMGRLIKTEMPDGTFSKVEFTSWYQKVFDANDTVKESEWFTKRKALPLTDPERKAVDKAELHAETPNVLHLDTLGRPVLSIDHNKNITTNADEFYHTKIKLDTEGNLRKVIDARELPENGGLGNTVMQYKYDMLGNLVYQQSMDAGQRWLLINILGQPLRTWDERNHEFQYFYDDPLHRPTHSKVLNGDGSTLLDNSFDRIIYGESLLTGIRTDVNRFNETALQAVNVFGKPIKHFDTGGVIETPNYDFKGQPTFITRKLFKKYKEVANWNDANLINDLEAGLGFTFTTETDALGRITKQTAPDKSIITPIYNETGLLNGEKVNHFNIITDAYEGETNYIKDIDYNEKGQRNKIIYGNDVTTKFTYDQETFRLKQLETIPKNAGTTNSANGCNHEWHYTFDAVGNITQIEDKKIPTVFFDNQKITGVAEYTYDALYRLAIATGRENNATLSFGASDNLNDAAYMLQHNPGDPMVMRNYTQSYVYDEVGNIKNLSHLAAGNNWTRIYNYEKLNNRLKSTQVGADTYNYSYLPAFDGVATGPGCINVLPHLQDLGWNFKEELIRTSQQKVNPANGIAETTYYQYDGQGQRIRKITENSAAAGANATKKEERIYIAGYETYRTYTGNTIDFERESLSLMDEGHRFVMTETVKQNSTPTPTPSELVGVRLVRYQLHNHLGSAALELDSNAQVISYEEYHPFGTTAYQANNATIKATAKRYRYTGMERDEETGLEYHSARYYLPWMGRWLSTDPKGLSDGTNIYKAFRDNPINFKDKTGLQSVGTLIDEMGVKAAGEDRLVSAYGWAFLGAAWNVFGAEGVSKVADDPSKATAGDYLSATIEVASVIPVGKLAKAGKGLLAGKEVAPAIEKAVAKEVAPAVEKAVAKEVVPAVEKVAAKETAPTVSKKLAATGDEVAEKALKEAEEHASKTGAFSATAAAAGEGLGKLAGKAALVSKEGFQIVEKHLARFGEYGPNKAMLDRLKAAMNSGKRISGADLSFYFHELNEATLMKKLEATGKTFDEAYTIAHQAALDKYGVSDFSVYAPEVIKEFSSNFNENWFKFWGISK